MSIDSWHVHDEMLCAYTRGETDFAASASIESHLTRCPSCRQRIEAVATEPLEAAWARVTDRIQTPRSPFPLRLLRLLGLTETDAVVLSAARSLSGAWTLAVVAVILFSSLAAIPAASQGRALYLFVAPLIPLIGVVAAFGTADPLVDLTTATPYSSARLALLRTVAVIVMSVPLSVALGAIVPGIAWLAFAWLLPALALTLVALVAMTWWASEPVGVVIASTWLAVVASTYATHDVVAAVRIESQVAYLAVAMIAAILLALRLRAARMPGGYA